MDYSTPSPKVAEVKRFRLRESDSMKFINKKESNEIMRDEEIQIPEILKYSFRRSDFSEKRLNLLGAYREMPILMVLRI